MRSIVTIAAAGLLLASARADNARTRPAAKKLPSRIVFCSDRDGPWRIWSCKPDGSDLKRLTAAADDAHDVDPAWAPGGAGILFTSTRGGKAGVWRMALPAGKPKRICDGDQAEWAPDAKKIALRRAGRIVVRTLAGGKERIVSSKSLKLCSGPAWSPDGRTIAFAGRAGDRNAVYLVPAAGGAAKKLYDKKGACEPHFSPDGKRIVYETETHICTIGVDGRDNRPVTWYGGVQRYGRYSPDGKRIVFCQAPSPAGPWQLYVVGAAGGTPAKLTEGASDMHPDWR